MSCSLSTYPAVRQAGPVAPTSAFRAAVESLQSADAMAKAGVDTRRPNYLLDVPVSAIDVDRWDRRWQEAAKGLSSSRGIGHHPLHFPHVTAVYGALMRGEEATRAVSMDGHSSVRHLAPFSPFNFASVKTLPMTQLLKMRRQWLPHRQRFPVHQQRMGFLDAVLNHAVVALVGPAGSGRTLQVPIVLSETEVLKRRRLVVISANATAARLTTLRLREERGEDVQRSRTVAAVVPNLNESNASTSIVVTTADVMLRQLLCDPCLEDVGCVVLDDAHLRSESTELCLSFLRDLLAVQQQWEHQRGASAAGTTSANTMRPDAATDSAQSTETVRRRRVHLVLNCPDESCASSLLAFLAPSRCTATIFTLQATPALLTASTTLYLDEAVQWLLKCEKEGSFLLRESGSGDGGGVATLEAALMSYAENVDAVARVMAAGDADFAHPTSFRRYWLPLIQQCVEEFDKADRQISPEGAAPLPLSAILIVAPNNYYVHVIANAMRETQEAAAEEDEASWRVCTALAEDAPFSNFLAVARRTSVKEARQRCIVVSTSELSQTVLPVDFDVGLVVDCARNGYTTVDPTTMADTTLIEYSTIVQLRHRRKLAKVGVASAAAASAQLPTGETARDYPTPMVIQLIPKSVLHGAHHRRLSADPGQHPIFRLPFSRYVHLYHVLQAREEAAAAQRAALSTAPSTSEGANISSIHSGDGSSVVNKVSSLLSAMLIGVPTATATRYEPLRRVMASVESYLRAAGHLAVNPAPGSTTTGQLVLQPIGVLCLCLPVALSVARLLLSSVLQPSLAALTAIGALWCCPDLLSLQGAGYVRAAYTSDSARDTVEEREALLAEARLFFSRDSLSDAVSAFHVYQMWCLVKDKPSAERDFLDECGVTAAVLRTVFETQVQFCSMIRRYGLLGGVDGSQARRRGGMSEAEKALLRLCGNALPHTADFMEELERAVSAAMVSLSQEVASDRTLHACVTAALYPCCIVPTGSDGVGLLYDPVLAGLGAAGEGGSGGAHGGGGGRRVATFSSDCVVANAIQGTKAAGKPFLFLAKSIADLSSREAVVIGNSSTAAAAVVEQVNPMHDAAAVVFCGHTFERPRKVSMRCRGWSSVLTGRWRETRRARGLPPVAQLPSTRIVLQSYDTIHCQQVVCTIDFGLSFTMRATTAKWLHQLRSHLGAHLAALTSEISTRSAADDTATLDARTEVAAELAEAWDWWERRHQHGREWLREERAVVAHQQQEGDENAEVLEQQLESEGKAAAMRQGLFSYYVWQTRPGLPAAVVVPANAEKLALARGAAAAATAKSSEAADHIDPAAALEEAEAVTETAASGLPATYSGRIPPADVDHIFRLCVKSVAAKGTREAEAQLLRDNPSLFGFLNPEDEFHEYYLYLLRQAAPDMEVLGDNLEELITFLEGLETELRAELGLPDATVTAQEGADGAAPNEQGNGEYGAYMWGSGTADDQWNSGVLDGYQIRDVPMGDGDGDDYGDNEGGLQLESAAINLKKMAGPSLAEKIEEAKRLQTSATTAGTASDETQLTTHNTSARLVGAGSNSAPPAVSVPAHSAAPFVSTNAGETLADKLKAMQMAAMGNTRVEAGSRQEKMPFANPSSTVDGSVLGPQTSVSGVLPAPPTAADLLAVINGSNSDAVGIASQPQRQQLSLDYQQAPPTAEELLALLGPVAPTIGVNEMDPLMGGSAGVLGAMPAQQQQQQPSSSSSVMAAMMLAPPTTPLHRPPPGIPAKAIEERPPSVLVYPVPDIRTFGNVRLLLAKSLSDALTVRVGPTTLVGHVARIDVPNRNVEARALALKKFTCSTNEAKMTVHLFKNDRIIDDPEREERERRKKREEHRRAEADRLVERRRRTAGERSRDAAERLKSNPPNGVPAWSGNAGFDPTSANTLVDPSAYDGDVAPAPAPAASAAAAATETAARFGVRSSPSDDDSSASSSSSSSSEATN